ncbi:aldehyde dehydrogenase family protein [Amphritea sp. 1_MG-2023]|uniref:aldehyde dehydrogenase family protein n=1 Tax=Amphritea sp. 1_MG-2023 TaxID=3062670 RepID=UPI0026E46967|nr:aldehyde dehydrogenase family protein [Amphritea sp. 1_MG-2023]MDO6563536.1 aldehyde dehydrogenase family protein [Amphritea sp. 1_MG-2023]
MNKQLYIGGKWVKSTSSKTIPVVNPATEEVFDSVAAANAEDVDAAVKAAREAFDNGPWSMMSGAQRAVFLRQIAAQIELRKDEIVRLEVLDNGKPQPEAEWDIDDAVGTFNFYADLAEGLDDADETIELSDDSFSSIAVKEPLGVAGAIIPWNFPLLMAAWKVAPALAAGCTMVLKPSEVTPLTALVLADIVDAVKLPAGVLNVVTGFGADAGRALSEHLGVDKLAFTGSVPTGSTIMRAAARDVKNISLELGGKSPFIVFADSDIEAAVEWIMFGIFWNQGQVCSATSRVLVEDSLYGPLLERLVEEANKITIGPGNEAVLLGPLVSEAQYQKVLAAIAQGVKEGAKIACGGQRPTGMPRGYYVQPTVLIDMAEESDVWQEEIFGPVVCVKPFSTEAEAIRLANDSRFGLAAAVMSKDDSRCDRVARKLRAGIVWINCSQPTFTEAPWGGYKQSGIGRELGKWGLNNYLETKQVTKYNSDKPWGWYLKS